MSALAYTAANIRPLVGSTVRQFPAGETLAPGDAVYIHTDGTVKKTDSDAAGTGAGVGIVVASSAKVSYATGTPVSVALLGPVAGFTGLTPGARGYTAATAGGLDTTAGTVAFSMGYAEQATVFFVLPGVAAPTS